MTESVGTESALDLDAIREACTPGDFKVIWQPPSVVLALVSECERLRTENAELRAEVLTDLVLTVTHDPLRDLYIVTTGGSFAGKGVVVTTSITEMRDAVQAFVVALAGRKVQP